MRGMTVALLGGGLCLIMLQGALARQEEGKRPLSEPTGSGQAAKQGSYTTHPAKEKSKSQPKAASEVVVVVLAPVSRARQCLTEILKEHGWRILAGGQDGRRIRAMRYLSSELFARAAETRRDNTRFSQGRAYLDAELGAVGNETRIKLRLQILAWADTEEPLARPTNFMPVGSTGELEGELRAALQGRCGSGSH